MAGNYWANKTLRHACLSALLGLGSPAITAKQAGSAVRPANEPGKPGVHRATTRIGISAVVAPRCAIRKTGGNTLIPVNIRCTKQTGYELTLINDRDTATGVPAGQNASRNYPRPTIISIEL